MTLAFQNGNLLIDVGSVMNDCCCGALRPTGPCPIIFSGFAHHYSFPGNQYPLSRYGACEARAMCTRVLLYTNYLCSESHTQLPFSLHTPSFVLKSQSRCEPPNIPACVPGLVPRPIYINHPPVRWDDWCDFNPVWGQGDFELPQETGAWVSGDLCDGDLCSTFDYADLRQYLFEQIYGAAEYGEYYSVAIYYTVLKWKTRLLEDRTPIYLPTVAGSDWAVSFKRHGSTPVAMRPFPPSCVCVPMN